MIDTDKEKSIKYCHFFLPEIKSILNDVGIITQIEDEIKEIEKCKPDNFEGKRLEGEMIHIFVH